MKQRKRVWSICLVIALVFSSVFTWNEPALTAYASTDKTEKIVVYVAAQGKTSDGKTVSIGKTPVQLDKKIDEATSDQGPYASEAVEKVLRASEYKYVIKESSFGPYLSSIGDVAEDDVNWTAYWSFYVNGQYSTVGLGSYKLQDGDQISLVYSYDDSSNEAAVFADNASLNPDTPAIESAETSMKQAQAIAAKEVYKNDFSDEHIPGLGNVNELYVVFSLARAGFEAPEFYGKVKYKLTRQLKELAQDGETYDAATKKMVKKDIFSSEKASEQNLSLVVLTLTALGVDVQDTQKTGGYDLLKQMALKTTYDDSDYNRDAMMLFALASGNYKLPEGEEYCTEGEIVSNVAKNIDTNIADAIEYGSIDDVMDTIMPLASHTEVQKDCQKVIRFAGKMQDADGRFADSEEDNLGTTAKVVTALGEFGINPLVETEDVDFVKNGHTLVDTILKNVDFDQEKMSDMVMNYSPEQVLRSITSFVYAAANTGETLYQVKTNPEIKEITEPFEDEKPQSNPSAEPSTSPSAAPSANSSTAPSANPSVAPSAVPSISPSASPSAAVTDGTSKKNPAKKIVASKKKVNTKKGKTVKIVIKVTAENPKKATTDAVKVTGKKIKVKKITKKAGKITIKVKALKKGKQVVKVKVGKASTKVTLNIR